jgi:hypothetical protein
MMRWEQYGDYARRERTHNLSISKAKVYGEWIYTLWEIRKSERDQDTMIGNFKTFEAARDAAKDLIDGRNQTR